MSATALHKSSDSCSSKSSRSISRRRGTDGPTLTFSRVGEAGPNVVRRQLWKTSQNLGFRHAARQIAEHVANGNPGTSNARFPESNVRIGDDAVE
jgi:hypothetical protein